MKVVNELRIGNYLAQDPILNGESFCTVHEISPNKVITKSRTLTGIIYDLDGRFIPLTEEWLKILGFEKFAEFGGTYYLNVNEPCNLTIQYRIKTGLCGLCCGDDFVNEIKYVHQLQNLYFALTGEELTIK